MADLTLDPSEEPSILGEQTHKPLVFNSNADTNTISNIILIDSNLIESQIFYDSANKRTFPIIYSYESDRDELFGLLQNKFASIERISFVFHDSVSGKTFLNNEPFFLETDFNTDSNPSLSSNVQFLLKIITDFAVKNVDFLQCNSLNHENWIKYYDLLNKNTNVIVGGSSDETGNLQYGGNWIMENTSEDIQLVYLTDYISNYTSTLGTTVQNTVAGENVIVDFSSNNYYYRLDNTSIWTLLSSTTSLDFSNNSTTKTMNVTFISRTYNYVINNINFFFNINSNNITFDGCGNTFELSSITDYKGLFVNGTSTKNGFYGITIKNFVTSLTTTTIASNSGNLLSSYFGRNANPYNFITNSPSKDTNIYFIKIENCTNNCNLTNSSGNIGGISGSYFCQGGYGIISKCTNNGSFGSTRCGGIVANYCADMSGCVLIENCINTGVFLNTDSSILNNGGIAGNFACYNNGILDISGCSNFGEINGQNTGPSNNSGICSGNGAAYNSKSVLRITNCVNVAFIKGAEISDFYNCGIMSGFSCEEKGTIIISNCINRGSIGNNGGAAGIFCQYSPYTLLASITIINCLNYGDLLTSYCGGIVGPNSGSGNNSTTTDPSTKTLNIVNCSNYGIINGSNSGGIVGFGSGLQGGSISILNCSNYGIINGLYSGGICGPFAGQYAGTIILNNCFNYGNILNTNNGGIGAGGICGQSAGYNCKFLSISNCYNLGKLEGTQCGGILGSDAGFYNMNTSTTGFSLNQIIDISNCYSTGIINNGSVSAAILGGRTYLNYTNDASSNNCSFTLKIKNCYTLSDPFYNTNVSDNSFNILYWNSPTVKINKNNLYGMLPSRYINSLKTIGNGGKTYVDISNNYSIATSGGIWNDISANQRLLNTPTDLYTNNPTNTWVKINSSSNTPYLLSSFNSTIYDPSYVIINNAISSYITSRGLFVDASSNYKYSLVSVNNANPTTSNIITLDPSFGNLTVSSRAVPKTAYTAKVFVSKTDTSGNIYSYNFNQFMFRNDYGDTIRNNGFVYIKQNTSNTIQYSLDKTVWTDISGGNAPDGKITISSYDPTATNILNVLFTTPITLSNSNSCNFIVKSNYITFDGSYNNTVDGSYNKITFNSISNYKGFIQNGSIDSSSGYYGIKVQNFITDTSGTSTLYSNNLSTNPHADGWLVGSYFGKNSKTVEGFNKTRVADAVSIQNITNIAPITSNYAGGICGSNFGYNSYATISNCSNVGDISGNYAGGICGSRVASNGGEVTITKTFNIADIRGQDSGGLCGTSSALPNATISSAADTSSNLIIRNSYSTGNITGINAGGICGSNTGFTSGNNYGSSKILIENCYSLGDVSNNGGKIIGGTNLSSTDVTFNNAIKIDISNCYGYGNDSSNNPNLHGYNFLQLSQSSSNKLTVNQTKWYNALKNSWLDASASQAMNGPENLYNNNPGSVWTSVKNNTPYVLANFNSPIYDPNDLSFNQPAEYKHMPGLFSYTDYSYNLISVNNIDPSYNGVYIDSSSALVFPSTIHRNEHYSAEVFVSKGASPYYTNYNYNNFVFSNNSFTIDCSSGSVYIKQDTSSNILFSSDAKHLIWTKILGNVTIYNSNWELGEVLTVLFQTDIKLDPSNSSYYDSETSSRDNFNFIVKSSYITFDGDNKNITFKEQQDYKGFIQNGTVNNDGYYGIIVKNFNTILDNTGVLGDNNYLYTNYVASTLRSVDPDSAGWLIASYFGKNSRKLFYEINPTGVFNKSTDVVSVQNVRNKGIIYCDYAGGICGSYFGSYNSYATIINCSNNGDIANEDIGIDFVPYVGCGGICGAGLGSYGGEVRIYNCTNDGIIYTYNGGGICGSKVADNSGNVLISNCYSVSDINGFSSGGICGQNVGCNNSRVTIQNCYSIGNIIGYNSGGICGADVGYNLTYPVDRSFTITNTSSLDITGAIVNNSTVNIINCYAIGDIKYRRSGVTGGKLIGGSNMIYITGNSDFNIGNITVISPAKINITKCFSNDSSNNDSGINDYVNNPNNNIYITGNSIYYNNTLGKYFTNFSNNNNTSIILTKKTFLVDTFNNQI